MYLKWSINVLQLKESQVRRNQNITIRLSWPSFISRITLIPEFLQFFRNDHFACFVQLPSDHDLSSSPAVTPMQSQCRLPATTKHATIPAGIALLPMIRGTSIRSHGALPTKCFTDSTRNQYVCRNRFLMTATMQTLGKSVACWSICRFALRQTLHLPQDGEKLANLAKPMQNQDKTEAQTALSRLIVHQKKRALDLPYKNKPDHATKIEKWRGRSRIKCHKMNKTVWFLMGVNCGWLVSWTYRVKRCVSNS